ncbi:GIY-YIG nuclease family protein [Cereibacter sphaeroides]|uniref:GIY-YIG nuclease family protein n=1 Tax=Cereibacter sphaeroides TaxID=1063 RepID=UPI001F1755B5|nr:GIY-YIG nuclease family protein [Cereibacter sphaeroides]MCE6957672.1 GIY-YIG nuclease family protein [Cereibacter sphaeroides]MCE6971408.1 GIY-YIG nuclease family protein [Cereibacter sphaeroides]
MAERDWRAPAPEEEIPASLDDIPDDDLDEAGPDLEPRHVSRADDRARVDLRSDIRRCPSFWTFEARFARLRGELKGGTRLESPASRAARHEPEAGDAFRYHGLMFVVAEKQAETGWGARESRLRLVFADGTETWPLMSAFRHAIEMEPEAFLELRRREDAAFGTGVASTIYVARTLSTDPALADLRNRMLKIGVTGQDWRNRVIDARTDPTFLMAPARVVAVYGLVGLDGRKVEQALHRRFAARRVELEVRDALGRPFRPREWFRVTEGEVAAAIEALAPADLTNAAPSRAAAGHTGMIVKGE